MAVVSHLIVTVVFPVSPLLTLAPELVDVLALDAVTVIMVESYL